MRRGAYVERPDGPAWQQRRHLALAAGAAAHRQLSGAVLSHDSAALVLGLRLWRTPQVTSVIQPHKPRAGLPEDVRRSSAKLDEADIVEIGGVRATRIERTVVDCARRLHPRDALVVADSGMESLIRPTRSEPRAEVEARTAELREQLLARIGPGSRGARQARAILNAASPLAGSAPESVVRWIVLSRGMSAPVLQQEVVTARGTVFTDLAWRVRVNGRVVWLHIEYDGTDKYINGSQGRDTARLLLEERRREAAITDTGDRVLRIYPDEILDEDRVFAKIAGQFSAATVAAYKRVPVLYRPPGWG